MAFGGFSARSLLSREQQEEIRFLNALKTELRGAVSQVQRQDGLTQEQTAEKLEMDPAQMSRVLRSDRHLTSRTIAQLMAKLGRRMIVSSIPLPKEQKTISSLAKPALAETKFIESTMTLATHRIVTNKAMISLSFSTNSPDSEKQNAKTNNKPKVVTA